VATLHIRNVPADLFEDVQRWAGEHDRSINAEVIDVLRRESERRREVEEFARRWAEHQRKYGDRPIDVDVVALIREDRDRGHKPDFGY
jgi:plasmid stability protein